MTVSQAAEVLGISPQRVRKLLNDKLLVGEKHGRDWWITEQELERFKALERPAHRPKQS